VQRVRLHYRKLAAGRFVGTRELGTVFLRAARRGRVPVAFTRGHRPMPRVSFGPALPLGATSDHELVDVDLSSRLPPAEVVRRFRAELPSGLVPVAGWEIHRSTPSIDASLEALTWELDLRDALEATPSAEALREAVGALLASERFEVERIVKRRRRVVDARPLVRNAVVLGPGRLRLWIQTGPGGSIKPALLVGTLLDVPARRQPLIRVHKAGSTFAETTDALALLGT
jgi:radical SAM-linked protein